MKPKTSRRLPALALAAIAAALLSGCKALFPLELAVRIVHNHERQSKRPGPEPRRIRVLTKTVDTSNADDGADTAPAPPALSTGGGDAVATPVGPDEGPTPAVPEPDNPVETPPTPMPEDESSSVLGGDGESPPSADAPDAAGLCIARTQSGGLYKVSLAATGPTD